MTTKTMIMWEEMKDLPDFRTPSEFSQHIEELAAIHKMTYVETIIAFCQTHMIEPRDIAGKINKGLRAKIEADFQNLNYLPKPASLF